MELTTKGLRENVSLVVERSFLSRRRAGTLAYIGGDGDANLGDEAMLAAAAGLLGSAPVSFRYPAQERRWSRAALGGSRFFSGAVLGGGTLINPHWYAKVQTALDQGLPMWALGTGAGSAGFGMPEHLDLGDWRPLLNRFVGVGVRGPRSKRVLDGIGVSGAEEIGDLALLLARRPAPRHEAVPTFVLNVTQPDRPSRDDTDYGALLRTLSDLTRSLAEAGWRPVPIAMHRTDIEPTQRVLQAAGLDAAVHCPPDHDAFFELAERATMAVAVRLHAAVLSACVGVPPLLLAYRAKCLDFMESLGLEAWCIPAATPDDAAAKAHELAELAPAMRGTLSDLARHRAARIETFARQTGLATASNAGRVS